MRALLLLLLLVCGTASAAPWTGILAPERAIDWSTAGIPGGIPTGWSNCTTTQCNTLYSSPTSGSGFSANVNAAIASAPANTVVRIPAGTFTMSANIYSNRSRVILRGAGTTQTRLNGNGSVNIMFGNGTGGQGNYEWGDGAVSWTGGLTRGSTVLTVSSTSNLHAGQTIVIDELNPSWVDPVGSQAKCTSGNSCGRGPTGLYGGTDNRALSQLTKIVSVDSSTQITIADPVAYTHTAGLSPEVFYWDACADATYGNCEYMGVEDLTFDAAGPGNTTGPNWSVNFAMCDYCWAKGIAVHNPGRGGTSFLWSYRGEVRNSYLDHTPQLSAPTQYGFDSISSSKILVINNIYYAITGGILPESSFGIVVAYNYLRQSALNENFFSNIEPHLSHNSFHLYEGNVMDGFNFDNVWGSSSHSTLFRNRSNGVGNNKTANYRTAVQVAQHQRYHNLVGNVLGDTTFATVYSVDDAHTSDTADGAIYCIGPLNNCRGNSTWDSSVRTSLMRWGNWDAVTYNASGGTAKGTRYCTGSGTGTTGTDSYNSACGEDERGSGAATFPALASPSTTLPASLFNGTTGVHESCGTMLPFWKNPGDGSCPPYPPIGPDVSCGSNCNSNSANHAAKIPAQLCYEAGTKDSDGLLTAFDPSVCYSADTGAKPNKPTGVH